MPISNKNRERYGKLDNVLVYHWQAWKGFLISHLVADHCQFEAKYEDTIAAFEHYLTPNIKAVLLQVNLSHSLLFPRQRQALIAELEARGVRVLNAAIDNISKSHLHSLLARANLPSAKAATSGPDDECLFIKSNLNWGGELERRLPIELQARFIGDEPGPIQHWDRYYCAKRGELDPALWFNNSIVIEKYIENQDNSFYRLYGLGDSLVLVKAHSPALIKKISGHNSDQNYYYHKREILESRVALDDKLQQCVKGFIENIQLPYFCLDIVHNGHDYYIIDLNLTPYSGVQEQTGDAIDFLRHGGQRYVKGLDLVESASA